MEIYPEHPWDVTKFKERKHHIPEQYSRGYWINPDHQREFFDQLAVKLNIKKVEDWYTVSSGLVKKYGGHSLMAHYGGSISKGS
jgi:hypothetical protein